MRILVVGGGGREHALCWSLARSSRADRLYAAPGNAGMGELATCIPVSAGDVQGLVEFAEQEGIDLTVVGPEAPLVAGLADEMQERGLAVFGPTREAARIEGSKAWARELCERHGIPTARSRSFTEIDAATEYLDGLEPPFVVKADGLAAGKGVTVSDDRGEAERALKASLVEGRFGDAGETVLVEEYLDGREVSALAFTDGENVAPLALAQDYKRALEGDRGPNTGGMGAFSPLEWVDPDTEREIAERILRPTVRALAEEGIRYRGVIYAGLMLTDDGPKVLEFNCRFGDPETQVILPRLVSDLPEVLMACVRGELPKQDLRWTRQACVGVVVASEGYPGTVRTGVPVEGLEAAEELPGVNVFHSGTASRGGRVVTSAGRVLTVTALGDDVERARELAYEACSRVGFDGMTYRRDVAERVRQEA